MSAPQDAPVPLETHVYTAEAELRRPGRLVQHMLTDLLAARGVAAAMIRRNLAAQYRQSIAGFLLAFCPALVAAAWSTLVQHARIVDVESLGVPYPAFVLVSMMLWTTFVEALQGPIEGLNHELYVLARARIPAEAVILAKLGEVGFNFAVKSLLIAGGLVWYGVPVGASILLAPAAVACLVALGTGIGLILAPLNILYQDVSKALGALTTAWFFLTPVLLPMPADGTAALFVNLNPVTPLLAAARELICLGGVDHPGAFAAAAGIALALLGIGWVFFRAALPVVIDRTNA
jgi:lipopolysaccharide transport system permease protein